MIRHEPIFDLSLNVHPWEYHCSDPATSQGQIKPSNKSSAHSELISLRPMKNKDQFSGCFFLVFSIVICVSAFKLSVGSLFNPGPGFVPFLSGFLLGIVSIGTLVSSLLFNKNLSKRGVGKGIKWKKIACALGILVGYSLVMTFIGFVTSTFLLLTSLFWGVERMSWWKAVLGSAAASIISYLFFVGWLQCQLPAGIVGY